MNRKGFTLVELVIVIVILGILAAIAMPKFIDITTDAKISATKAGLGAVRSVIALKYSRNLAGGTATVYPTTLLESDFFDSKYPKNELSGNANIVTTSATATSLEEHATAGWWFIATDAPGGSAGQAGAYSDGATPTNLW